MLKAIRWCTASLVVVATFGAVTAQDDAPLEKALIPPIGGAEQPSQNDGSLIPRGEALPPNQPGIGQTPANPGVGGALDQIGRNPAAAPGNVNPAPAPNLGAPGNAVRPGAAPARIAGRPGVAATPAVAGGVAVGGTVTQTTVAVPAPRPLFMGAAIGPFGEPLPMAMPRICMGEALLLKGAVCGAPVGRVILQVDQLIFDARIVDWAENGVHAVLPTLGMVGPTHAMLHVMRVDGIRSDTLPVILMPAR